MRKILLSLLIGLLSFSFMLTDVQAKRFGGGKSFGSARQASSSFMSNSASRVAPALAKPASNASKWLGPLAGLAIGGMLASLFMGHGLGGGLMSALLIGGAVFLIWRFISSRMQQPVSSPSMQNAHFSAQPNASSASNYSNQPIFSGSTVPRQDERLNQFDEASFVRQAKSLFIRLQAAYDTKNLADIREFTAPEIFAEIQLQLQERGNEANITEVVNIDAQLLGVEVDSDTLIASVLFSGLIREEQAAEPIAIKEMWNFSKDDSKGNWIVTGIQQS